jgi:membrane protein implicated in regulation of membrane protease activity
MQTRTHSAFEAVANVAVGYLVGLAAQVVIFPLVGVQASFGQNLVISVFFTLVSLARSYLLRRWFNRLAAAAVAGADREEALITGDAPSRQVAECGCGARLGRSACVWPDCLRSSDHA